MNRIINRSLVNSKSLLTLAKCVSKESNCLKGSRCLMSQTSKSESLFPERVDFPSRHIGPRDQDIVTMLDSLGYKVRSTFFSSFLE